MDWQGERYIPAMIARSESGCHTDVTGGTGCRSTMKSIKKSLVCSLHFSVLYANSQTLDSSAGRVRRNPLRKTPRTPSIILTQPQRNPVHLPHLQIPPSLHLTLTILWLTMYPLLNPNYPILSQIGYKLIPEILS